MAVEAGKRGAAGSRFGPVGVGVAIAMTPTQLGDGTITGNLTPEELDRVDDLANDYTRQGVKPHEARQRAIDDVLAERASLQTSVSLTAESFETSIKGLSPGERVGRVKETLAKVAEAKGWKEDRRVSKLNKRDVYKDKKENYWSVDTEKGRFEKTNKRGKHQGEFNIDGKQTGPADNTGGHDLEI